MKVTENSTYRLMQTNLDRITTDLQNLRKQGASGLKLNLPSDDPSSIRPVLTTRWQMQENDRYLETMGITGDKMAATDSSLGTIENVLVRAKEIAINGVNGGLSQADLNTLADEVEQLRNQLLDTANSVIDGKYIFSGFQTNIKPFTVNPTYDPNTYDPNDVTTWPVLYHGDANTTKLEISPGEFLAANITGNELFMGISNAIAAGGYSNPYQGESMTSGPISVGTPGNDITITTGATPPVTTTILGTSLTDTDTNYAAKVAGLLSQTGTGLTATTNAATVNLGPLTLTNFGDGEDTYTLSISSGGNTVSAALTGPTSGFDFTLSGLAWALANTAGATNLTPTSGTLSNGVRYDISSGSLVLTGASDGSDIDLTEVISNGGTLVPAPTGGITGGNQTVYGTINVATNSATNVSIAGAGLASIGLTANTLDGASGKIDLFAVLTREAEALRAGNISNLTGPGGSLQAQIDNLEIAADQNRNLRSNMGARAQRVDNATTQQQNAQVDLKQILSRYQDADVIQIFSDISQKESAYQAALSITGRVSKISILDYL